MMYGRGRWNKPKIIKGILRKRSGANGKWLCLHCLKSGKHPGTCGIQGHKIISTHHSIRWPSYKDSKQKWFETLKAIGWTKSYPRKKLYEADTYFEEFNENYSLLIKTLTSN